jgi:glycosyltransferase involved in cell wall biosynthesis
MRNTKLLVFDSHPIQYRAPIWQTIEAMDPGMIHVVYATDCTIRGHADAGFGKTFAWDEPLLDGYKHTILNCEKGTPLAGWGSITGKGIKQIIRTTKPKAVLLTGLNYKYDLVAYLHARLNGIPVWLRWETQDEAAHRSKFKTLIRSIIYRSAYLGISRFFYIGNLNRQHYLVDRFENFTTQTKMDLRKKARVKAGFSSQSLVVGFSGKFIDKKAPDILFTMLDELTVELRQNISLYFIGSGALEPLLTSLADKALKQYGVKTYFAGFINQSQLPEHYLAMDILVLPSRRMNETWGLVANEAMQAGCGVVVSDAVGCGANFASWERFRIFKEADAKDLAKNISELALYSRNFDWAAKLLKEYSITATAGALTQELKK